MPAEIRNAIWKLVLGGKVYRSHWKGRFYPSPTEPKDATALLRTCRQIYSEAAIMPLALTIFSVDNVRAAERSIKKFKPNQRKQITTLQFTVPWPHMDMYLGELCFAVHRSALFRSLSALQELRILVLSVQDPAVTREKVEEAVHEHLRPSIQDVPFAVKVDHTHQGWGDYVNS